MTLHRSGVRAAAPAPSVYEWRDRALPRHDPLGRTPELEPRHDRTWPDEVARVRVVWLAATDRGVVGSVLTQPFQLHEVRTGLVESLSLAGSRSCCSASAIREEPAMTEPRLVTAHPAAEVT